MSVTIQTVIKIKTEIISGILNKIITSPTLRKPLIKKLDSILYQKIVENCKDRLKPVQEKKYQYMTAMLHHSLRNIDKGYISKEVTKKIVKSLVVGSFMAGHKGKEVKEAFKEKHGIAPPSFLVFSPTMACNLRCTGCYASVGKEKPAQLSFEIVNKVVDEAFNVLGNRFMTISGGEPFVYNDNGKTLFDVWEKYPDMFFLVYTNGTFITPEIAQRLAKLGNVTPAISVEGFEKETDDRRGDGIFKKVLEAMKNLREAGVPFGTSVTSTSKNVDILLKDEFYNYFFEEQGASYMWQFQLMPIGKGKDVLDLMVKPQDRIKLFRQWERMLKEKQHCIADFWNSGMLTDGCIAYGRGYVYIDWDGKIAPCVFVPYYVDNVKDLYAQGKGISDALNSEFFKNGRKWQQEYVLANPLNAHNLLMPCSIRDHYKNFRDNILTAEAKPQNSDAKAALEDPEYREVMENFGDELEAITQPVWDEEYADKENAAPIAQQCSH